MLHLWVTACYVLGAGSQPASPIAERLRTQSYERWVAQPAYAASGQDVARAVLHYGRAHSLRLVHDARLDIAAQSLVSWANTRAGTQLPFDALQTTVWQTGDTDAGLAALALHANPNDPVGLSVQKALAQTLPRLVANRFGLARAEQTVVVAFAYHWMHLAPTPAEVGVGRSIRIAGQDIDPRVETLTLAVARPDGTLSHTRPPILNAAFAEQVAVGDKAGVLDVQVLIDRGAGPEVAAQYPVGVGKSPWTVVGDAEPPPPLAAAHPAALTQTELAKAKQALLTLVWGFRRAHGLALPDASPALMTVAQRHSDDMGAHHFFAHISARTGDVTQRLGSLHQPYVRVVENIAAGTSLDTGFAQWMHSPSHRANLLDPSVTHIGVGISEGDAPDDVLLVLVMARLS